MADRRRRRSVVGTVLRGSMTPMIDVTFLLLVFFLSTTRWAREERVIAMDLAPREAMAEAAAGAATAPPPAPKDPFVLRDEALRLSVRADGSVDAGTPMNRRLTLPDLRGALAAECRGTAHPTGMFEPSFPIVIAPADDAPWEVAVSALDAATAAGFRNVGFERMPGRSGAGAAR
ncbi:MAG: ExbD/TolR family protein [Phycisphaerales bacterium]